MRLLPLIILFFLAGCQSLEDASKSSTAVLQDIKKQKTVEHVNSAVMSVDATSSNMFLLVSDLRLALPPLITNLDHLVQRLDKVAEKAEKIEDSLRGKDEKGETVWWAKSLKNISGTLLKALQYGAMILAVVLGRILWKLTHKVNNAPPEVRNNILRPGGRDGRWSFLAVNDICGLQDGIRIWREKRSAKRLARLQNKVRSWEEQRSAHP
jgi:hypothetical protein